MAVTISYRPRVRIYLSAAPRARLLHCQLRCKVLSVVELYSKRQGQVVIVQLNQKSGDDLCARVDCRGHLEIKLNLPVITVRIIKPTLTSA